MLVGCDSGGYSVYTAKKKGKVTVINIHRYIFFLINNRDQLDISFNLDVIDRHDDRNGEVSYENWKFIRRYIPDIIPVYHYGKRLKYLYEYLRKSDYVAIGGSADASFEERVRQYDYLWENHLVDSTGWPIAKVHAFGLMSPKLLDTYPWHSADGTTWVEYSRLGSICMPKIIESKYLYNESPTIVSVSNWSRDSPDHIENLPHWERLPIMQYIEEKGFCLGRGEPDDPDYEPGLCNDLPLRYQINAVYYSHMGQALGKTLYLAGNIDALKKPEIERSIQQAVHAAGCDYRRFISYAFYPDILTVIKLKEEEENYG